MTALLTGFNSFADVEINPTQLIVERLSKRPDPAAWCDLVAEVLPTEFVTSGNRIVQLLREHRPETVICLGVAAGIGAVHLERVALNLDDAAVADNAGLAPAGERISPDGPLAYWSTLPIEEMRDVLSRQGIPATISNHAGTYVCNHVFYLVRHEAERLKIPSQCGFIHVPQVLEAARAGAEPAPGLALEAMVDAVECCLRVCAKA